VLVAVQDSGPRLQPQSRDRLFEAFYTAKPHVLGMGLAISRSIVEAHEAAVGDSECATRSRLSVHLAD
jgi:signal transduction histidine kinase